MAFVFSPSDNIVELLLNNADSKSIIDNAKSLTKKDFDQLLKDLSTAYYHEEAITDDQTYDLLESLYQSKYGKAENGANHPHDIEVKLPYPMPSLDKKKSDKELSTWKSKWGNDYISSDKLDGVTSLYELVNGKAKLYKNSKSGKGTDISQLLKYIPIPNLKENITIRGEIVMPSKIFKEKYSKEFKKARNLVAGLTNPYSKSPDPNMLKDLRFVPYYIYTDPPLKQSDQFDILKNHKFEIPNPAELCSEDLTEEVLGSEYKLRQLRSSYEIDGIVIVSNIENPPKLSWEENPDHMIAFKILGETALATVVNIDYQITKNRLLKPVVEIEPVNLSGCTIKYITAFNGKYVVDNGLGKNSKIILTRSGDVIPYILSVSEKVNPRLPNIEYVWNESGVEMMLPNGVESDENIKSRIGSFFSTMGSKYIGEETIAKLYDNNITTLKQMFNLTVKELIDMKIGFQKKSAEKIIENIQKSINGVELYKIMAASCLFPGLGRKRLRLIIEKIPDILEQKDLEKIKKSVQEIPGIKTLATTFIRQLPIFKEWLENHTEIILGDAIEISEKKFEGHQTLEALSIVMTGFRDKDLEKIIKSKGGIVEDNLTKLTDILIVKDLSSTSGKIQKAQKYGTKIISLEEFTSKYIDT
jgi:DNA ligase (NAD+)